MIVKGIIQSLEDDGYQAKVRIPKLNKIESASTATPNSALYTATICMAPGVKPSYKSGDIVFIGFEGSDTAFSSPVILGCLYRPDNISSCNIYAQSVSVSVNSNLSSDTSIGDVSASNIACLTKLSKNIQENIDLLDTRVSKLEQESS